MTDMADLERHVDDWLRVQAPARAPAPLLTNVLDRIAVIPQQRTVAARLSVTGDRLGRSGALRYVLLVALIVAAIVAALLFAGAPRPALMSDGWIAYRKADALLVVDPDAPRVRRVIGASHRADPIGAAPHGAALLLRPHPDAIPFWQDGTWWIGRGDSDPVLAIARLEIDSSGIRTIDELTALPGGTWGSFSPDGSRVAYATDGSDPGPYVIRVDGGEPRSVLGDECRRPGCGEPLAEWAAWSPRSSEIAWLDFWEDHPKFGHHAGVLSFVNADGTNLREAVVQLPGETGGLVWSPDGSRLALWIATGDEGVPAQIYVIDADGSGLRRLTNDGDSRWPTWSPDGSRIAFGRGELTALTGGDGSQMRYVEPGSRQLFTMAADGTDVRLIEGVHPDGPTAWIAAR